jgi:hypothetical protein
VVAAAELLPSDFLIWTELWRCFGFHLLSSSSSSLLLDLQTSVAAFGVAFSITG